MCVCLCADLRERERERKWASTHDLAVPVERPSLVVDAVQGTTLVQITFSSTQAHENGAIPPLIGSNALRLPLSLPPPLGVDRSTAHRHFSLYHCS